MKRLATVLIGITIVVSMSNTILASENVDIYSEPEIILDGRIELNFMCKMSDRINDSIPVSNVQIELYYYNEGQYVNINDLDIFKYTNHHLVSDENGKIVITNIPCGLYQYRITSAPEGYKYNSEDVYLRVILLDLNVVEYSYLTQEVHITGGEPEIPSEIIPEKEPQKEPEITIDENKEEEEQKPIEKPVVQETVLPSKETDIKEISINTFSTEVKEVENIPEEKATPEQKVMKQINKQLKEREKMNKHDMLRAMRKYRLTDMLKVAVLDSHITHDMYKTGALPKNDKDIDKKRKYRVMYIRKNATQEYREYKNVIYSKIINSKHIKG